MAKLNILGYSINALSLLLETLKATGENGPIRVVQNIPVAAGEDDRFIPPGVEVSVHAPDEHPGLSPTDRCILGVLNPGVKQKVFEYFYQQYRITEDSYIRLCHPSAVVAATVTADGGYYIEPLTVVSPFAHLGFGVTLNRGVSIGHHTRLGNFVTVGPGADIAGHTRIGDHSSIGIGAVVFDHIQIGKNCIIGGGSVVTKDIPDAVVAWGNPCRVIKSIAT